MPTAFTGAALKAARKALGLKQAELAAHLGTTQDVVSGWETGKLRMERPAQLGLALEGLRQRIAPHGRAFLASAGIGLAVEGTVDPGWLVRHGPGNRCGECDWRFGRGDSYLERRDPIPSAPGFGHWSRHLCLNCAARGGTISLRRIVQESARVEP